MNNTLVEEYIKSSQLIPSLKGHASDGTLHEFVFIGKGHDKNHQEIFPVGSIYTSTPFRFHTSLSIIDIYNDIKSDTTPISFTNKWVEGSTIKGTAEDTYYFVPLNVWEATIGQKGKDSTPMKTKKQKKAPVIPLEKRIADATTKIGKYGSWGSGASKVTNTKLISIQYIISPYSGLNISRLA